jgi:tetratricopeptide (TPR) repeat protein
MLSEDWEQPYHRANELFANGRFQEACQTLVNARKQSQGDGDAEAAAFFSNILGSFLAAQGKTGEAIQAYQVAETLDPSNLHWKLATANCLLFELNDPAAALTIASSIAQPEVPDKSILHSALSIGGISFWRLGKKAAAIDAFEKSTSGDLLALLPPSGCDLRLAELLLAEQASVRQCHDYLNRVLVKAIASGDVQTQEVVQQLILRSQGPP